MIRNSTGKMRNLSSLLIIAIFITACSQPWQKDYPVRPVDFTGVHLTDHFWAPRIEINRTVTIPFAFRQCEETGRIDNFAIAGGLKKGEHKGDYPFDDTDVYKLLEGAAYTLAVHPDKALEAYCDSLIRLVAAAQEKDGYLYTCRTNRCARLERWMGKERWEKLNSHELYNMGHLYEAAVAYYQATGKRRLLDVAVKNADLICQVFGPRPEQKHCPSGHPIIEMALVKLYRTTGERKYLRDAKFFLDETGYGHDGHKPVPYSQDHMPLKEQDEAVGHAVRAGYLYSGVADVAALTDDAGYVKAIDRLWDNVVTKKLYVTGGIGARAFGEGFGDNYELPNMTAYCETCASVANVFWNYRLFLLHGDAKYIDVLERTLYNALLSGVSLSGDRFFYDNPLASNGIHERRPWFGCACCPGNITRFLASVPGYFYAVDGRKLYVNLYASGKAKIGLGENNVSVEQQTEYPWDGTIRITVKPEAPARFALLLRIPGWARNSPVAGDLYTFLDTTTDSVSLLVNGKAVPLRLEKGYACLSRRWQTGDIVTLTLPMPVRRVISNDRVADDTGKVALQCGPIVYCVEWADYDDHHVMNLFLPDSARLVTRFQPGLLNGIKVITGHVCQVTGRQDDGQAVTRPVPFTAIPYAVWENRGPGEMTVWIPWRSQVARITPPPSIASTSRVTVSAGDNIGLNDQFEPRSSHDNSTLFFYWWLKNGTREWVQYNFQQPATISSVEVYWFEFSHYDYECRVPESWELLYCKDGMWMPVTNTCPYGCDIDMYNVVTFAPVETDALRLEAQLQKDYSAGIIEWKVYE